MTPIVTATTTTTTIIKQTYRDIETPLSVGHTQMRQERGERAQITINKIVATTTAALERFSH